MADEKAVRQYLAYWFQAGKRIILEPEGRAYCPRTVIQGDRYSPEFERCWSYLIDEKSGDCHLEGAQQTIHDLLSPRWEVSPCARCDMPVPMLVLGVGPEGCPCSDLPNWPNDEIPRPRSPISTSEQLAHIRDRLLNRREEKSSSNHGSSHGPSQQDAGQHPGSNPARSNPLSPNPKRPTQTTVQETDSDTLYHYSSDHAALEGMRDRLMQRGHTR